MAPLIASLNHLLAQEPWARQQLSLHRAKVAVIDSGAIALRLQVCADGLLEAAPAGAVAAVTIRLKLSDVPLMLQQRERAFSYVNIEGDAEFANTISQLSKTVRWDAAHDLEKLVGQIAAVRIVSGAQAAFAALHSSGRKLAENAAEFLLEERPVLVRANLAEDFGAEVTRLRDDVERMGKRLDRLEQKLARHAAAQTLPAAMTPHPLDPT